jgi:hypothetical protein
VGQVLGRDSMEAEHPPFPFSRNGPHSHFGCGKDQTVAEFPYSC